MKIMIKELGVLRQAQFELGDLTIICGENNTGKTYATYALYGFLKFWHEAFTYKIDDSIIDKLLKNGVLTLDLNDYIKQSEQTLTQASKEYKSYLPMVFASAEKNFENSEFSITLDPSKIKILKQFKRSFGTATKTLFDISKSNDHNVVISLIIENQTEINEKWPSDSIARAIGDAIKDIIYNNQLPDPFIASAERTGAAIFRKELKFTRNRLLEQMGSSDKDISLFDLFDKVMPDYAMPVKRNVDFTRQLEDIAKKESFLAKEHTDVLKEFAYVIGGNYKVTRNDELYFVPSSKRNIKLTMDESSSSVRSLLDIGFYLRHVAQPGDLLMVDEPELNLHPENQRRVARLFARLVNLGIKVFITTHSDYIIKELNTLLMLNSKETGVIQIRDKEGYKKEELLSAEKLKVYIAECRKVKLDNHTRRTVCNTLTPADIDPVLGIDAPSFDKTIDSMNRIQDAIYFSREGK